MKLSRILPAALLLSIAIGIGIAHAAGSATNGGTAPTLTQAGVEYIQTFWTNGPAMGGTIKSVTYKYTAHQICAWVNPVGGGCAYANIIPQDAYLCMTTTQTGPVTQAPDLKCTTIQVGTNNSTSAFNGVSINAMAKRPRWYFGFIAAGTGTLSPAWEGRADSVTVNW